VYQEYYGLTERPFDLTPNSRYLYLTPMHREALAAVQYAITARRGIAIVVGEAGTGKTTVVRAALRALKGQRVHVSYLNNPTLTRTEFLQFLTRAFGLGKDAATSKVDLLSALTAKLARYHAADTATVLVVDEAQSLPNDLLEEIRLLANIETSTAKLLQVVLMGQPELAERLNDPSLRPLKQRVAIRAQLGPLDLRGTSSFIAGRLRVAGGQPAAIFTPKAVELIYAYSGGVPRTINVICDNALLTGFATDARPIGPAIIDEVARDFDLKRREPGGSLELRESSQPALRPARQPAAAEGPAALWPRQPAPAPAPAPGPVPRPAASRPVTLHPEGPPPEDERRGGNGDDRALFSGFGGRRRWFSS
jgi:type II secretory pathway predicted ATPase ExeA